jgi:hypothetical protein
MPAKRKYGYRRKPRASLKNVPKSPSTRPSNVRWSTVTIRSEHYAMLRELCEYYRYTIGSVAMMLIEERFNELLAKQQEEEAHEEEVRRATNRP